MFTLSLALKSLAIGYEGTQLAIHTLPCSKWVLRKAFGNQEIESQGMQDIIQKNRDIEFIASRKASCFHVFGNGIFSRSPKIIVMDPDFVQNHPHAAVFWCRHQVCHLKHNDIFSYRAVLLVIVIAASILTTELHVFILITFVSHVIALNLFESKEKSINQEILRSISSPNEREGAYCYFKASSRAELSTAPWQNLLYNLFTARLFDIHFGQNGSAIDITRSFEHSVSETGQTNDSSLTENVKTLGDFLAAKIQHPVFLSHFFKKVS